MNCVLSHFSRACFFATLWTVAHQDSMGFPRQKYWSGLPFPPPGDLPNPGIETASLPSPVLAGGFFTTSATWEVPISIHIYTYISTHTHTHTHTHTLICLSREKRERFIIRNWLLQSWRLGSAKTCRVSCQLETQGSRWYDSSPSRKV